MWVNTRYTGHSATTKAQETGLDPFVPAVTGCETTSALTCRIQGGYAAAAAMPLETRYRVVAFNASGRPPMAPMSGEPGQAPNDAAAGRKPIWA
jgi:hypothetical protein